MHEKIITLETTQICGNVSIKEQMKKEYKIVMHCDYNYMKFMSLQEQRSFSQRL